MDKKQYLQKVMDIFKDNPDTDELNKSEKILLQQAFNKEGQISKILEETSQLEKDIKEKQKKLQLLDQQVILERGQLIGLVDALLALKSEE